MRVSKMANLSGWLFPTAVPPSPEARCEPAAQPHHAVVLPRQNQREETAALPGSLWASEQQWWEAICPLTGPRLHWIGANSTSARACCALAQWQIARLITLLGFSPSCSRGGIHFTGQGGKQSRPVCGREKPVPLICLKAFGTSKSWQEEISLI